MGNCQASEAAAVAVLHPGGRIQRVYWPATAGDLMGSNPGHYVAMVLAPPHHAEPQRRHLKLLRPEDALRIGNVYRLVTFEEVVKGVGAKRHVKLRRLLMAQQLTDMGADGVDEAARRKDAGKILRAGEEEGGEEKQQHAAASGEVEGAVAQNAARGVGAGARRRQWRPALQSIAEVGSG